MIIYKKIEPENIITIAVAMTPLVYLPIKRIYDYYSLPKVYFMMLLTAAYLVLLLKNRKQLKDYIDVDKINIILFIYGLLLFVSIFFAENIVVAFNGKAFREEGFRVLLMYLLFFLAARSAKKINDNFVKGMLITAVLVAGYGIIQFYGFDPIPNEFLLMHIKGAVSTMGNPNYLGSYLVLMIPFSIHCYVIDKKKWGLATYGVILLCLLCTRTRGAWLGTIFGVSVYFMFLYRMKLVDRISIKKITNLALLSVVIITGLNLTTSNQAIHRFLSIFSDAYNVVSGSEEIEKAGSYRFFLWKRVVRLIAMKPWFGHGIDHLHFVFNQYFRDDIFDILGRRRFFDRAHNEYLHIAVSSGIPALISYLCLVSLSLKRGLNRLFYEKNVMLIPVMASVCGYLLQAFFTSSIVSMSYIYWIFSGILVSGEFKTSKS